MARQAKRPEFNPNGPFVARRDFPFNGKLVKRGVAFTHAKTVRQFRQLYTSRHIDLGLPKIKAEPKAELDDDTILNLATAATGIKFRSVERAKRALAEIS